MTRVIFPEQFEVKEIYLSMITNQVFNYAPFLTLFSLCCFRSANLAHSAAQTEARITASMFVAKTWTGILLISVFSMIKWKDYEYIH